MQTRLREENDGDLVENYVGITDFETAENRFEINCRECNKSFYADRETSEGIYHLLKQGLDNPFLCNDCQQDYEELAREK